MDGSNQLTVQVLVCVLLVAAVPVSVQPAEATACTTISGPTTITQSGCYSLADDVTDSTASAYITVEASDVTVDGHGHLLDGVGDDTAVKIDGSYTNVVVQNLDVRDWSRGVYLKNVADSEVRDVSAVSNQVGIELDGTSNTDGYDLTVSDNTGDGLYVAGTTDTTLDGVTASNNGDDGLEIYKGDGVTASNVDADDNAVHGALVTDTTNAVVADSSATGNGQAGFRLHHTDGIEVTDLSASTNQYGLFVSAEGATVDGGQFTANAEGVRLHKHVHTLRGATVDNNGRGVVMSEADNNVVTRNRVRDNTEGGVVFPDEKAEANQFYDNLFDNADNVVFLDDVTQQDWEVTPTAGTNIVGGSTVAGNFWGTPDDDGPSEYYDDADGDGIRDTPYTVAEENVDQYPLTTVGAPFTVASGDSDFGSVDVSTTATETVTLENRVDGTVTLDAVTLSGSDVGAFTLTTDPTPTTLAAGETVSVTVDYAPSAVGTDSVTLDLDAADDSYDTSVTLTGTAVDTSTPVADAGTDRTVDEDTSVGFDASGSADNVGIVSYEWDFGDGTTATGETASHTYETPGTYAVELTATDAVGNSQMDTTTVTVRDVTAPTATTGGDKTVDEDTSVGFDASGSTDNVGIVSYTWDFGDGDVTTGETASHIYDTPGSYTVELTATDAAGNTDTRTLTVDVTDVTAPVADAGTSRTTHLSTSTGFDAGGSTDNVGIVSYEWDFGDGTTATGETASHTYGSTGTYTVELTVTDAAGNVGTDTTTVTVSDMTDPLPEAGTDQTVDDGQQVSLDASGSSDDGTIASYTWDFGDGTTATGETTSHTYDAPGTYTVSLTVADDAGNTATDELRVTVRDVTDPVATVSADASGNVPLGTAVAFDASTSSDDVGVDTVEWTFGDGTTGDGLTPTHTYATPGTYTATATVTDAAGNSQTDSVTVDVVDATAPTAVAGSDRTVDEGTTLSFTSVSSTDNVGITSYEWDFGDGTTGTGLSPSKTYTDPGTYTVELTVTDAAGNVGTDTLTVDVADVTAPTADAGGDRAVGVTAPTTFDASGSTDNVGIASYTWDFGDGTTATGETASHTYDGPGTYTVSLTVEDAAGNADTTTTTVTVADETAPTADAGDDRAVAVDDSVSFDASESTDNLGVTAYRWDFGDGTTATGRDVSHVYDTAGRYTVTLTVKDAAGNADTETLTVDVTSEPSSSPPAPSPTTSTPTPTPTTNVNNTSTPNTTTQVVANTSTTNGTNTSVVDVAVDETTANETVRIDMSSVTDETAANQTVAVASLNLTPTTSENITMRVTTSDDQLEGSPTFETDDFTEPVSRIRIDHSIPNENLTGTVDIRFTVSETRLAERDVAPEDVALYRYENGTWRELETAVVGERDGRVVFEAISPGLSEFATGAKRPKFTMQSVRVDVEEITVGDDVRVYVTIANDGGADGEFLTTLHLDERVVEERELTIAAGGRRQLLFDHVINESGSYEARVNDVIAGTVIVRERLDGRPDGSPTATAEPTTTAVATSDRPQTERTAGAGPGVLLVGLLAVLGVVVLARLRPSR